MKKFIKSISLTLCVVILSLSLFSFTNNSLFKVEAMELETDGSTVPENKIETEQKIYSNTAIDSDFADDSVIVVFKKSTSDYNKIFTTKDFSEVKCNSINDITKYKRMLIADKKAEKIATLEKTRGLSADKIEISDKEIIKEYNIDVENFQNMICLELEEKGKDKVLEAIEILEKREDIIYAGPNYFYSLFSETTTQLTKETPNDEYYVSDVQWAIDDIQLPEAWAITTGSSDVLVGVIDSGIDKEHPELVGKVSETLSFDFTTETIEGAFNDVYGHGTQVAGIIGAKSDNEDGIVGAAWDVTLVSLKTYTGKESSESDCTQAALAEAINYAEYRGIKILNHSGGRISQYHINDNTGEPIYPIKIALNNYSGIYVCAAGNHGYDLEDYIIRTYPATYDYQNIISVAAYDKTNNLWNKSNYGYISVDLAAPGVDIMTIHPMALDDTEIIGTTDTIDDGYTSVSGTSMAAPYVSGIAALMMNANPYLTPFQIKCIILEEVNVVSGLEGKVVTSGMLNAYKSVSAANELFSIGYYALTTSGGRAFYDTDTPWFSTSQPGRIWTGDINGDGTTDLMGIDINGDICYSIANSIGEYGAQGKITGSYGLSPDIDPKWFLNSYNSRIWVDDVNGDGYDDFMLISVAGSMLTMMNNGNMTFSGLYPSYTGNAFNSQDGWFDTTSTDRVWTGDVDGNGYADFIGISPTGSVYCSFGDGEGNFGNPTTITMPNAFDQSWFSASYAQRIWFEDVNGDNKDDFIGVSVSGDIYVSLNNVNLINGNYTFSAPTNKGSSPFLTSSGWFSSNYTSRVWPADVNGDDKLDLVGIDTNGDIIIEMNTGLFIQIEVEVSNGYNSSYFTNTSRQRVWACDIDGDDKADFVGVDSQGYIYSLRQRRIIIS